MNVNDIGGSRWLGLMQEVIFRVQPITCEQLTSCLDAGDEVDVHLSLKSRPSTIDKIHVGVAARK